MSAKDILDDRVKRMEIQKTWPERMTSLKTSRASFCDRMGIAPSTMCRLLNLTYAAGWDTINRVEKAMKKENL